MAEAGSHWVGKDEAEGIPVQPRKDVSPPPHWRLEAVAATERPRSLALGADRRHAVFIQDRDTSDVWLLDLEDPTPRRLTTGRDPMPHWEDTQPRLSPDGSQVAYGDDGHVWLVAAGGGPPRKLLEAAAPVWLDDATLVVSIERGDTTRLAVVDVADPWPRRLATAHGDLDERGDEGGAAVSPDRAEVAYVFTPRADLNRSEIRVAAVETGAVRAVTGTPLMQDRSPDWSPDGTTIAYVSERSGAWALHAVGRDGSGERQLTQDGADYGEPAWHPAGDRVAVTRGVRNRYGVATVDAATGAVAELAQGGVWGAPQWTASGALIGTYEDHATPPELRLAADDPGSSVRDEASGATTDAETGAAAAGRERGTRTLLAPAPLAVKRAPHVTPRDVTFPSRDGLEIPGFLFRPPTATLDRPVPAIVYPHGGPTDAYMDLWDGHAQYFIDKGYAWLAVNFRGSTGYGREFERANHGVWGVADTWDCLAAADHLRSLDWIDGDRLAIFGASYGSYMALLTVTDDPEHRFRCAVAKYGDCDILTSWAQGDREGVQDLERMMGHPATARAAYHAGSPIHRIENVEAPLLIAHGERDERVSPKQSEELVAALRRTGKTFEFVTYPTEAHGLLRAGPQLHFYRRLERFLDWYLL
jgi:dipeptidyl aminopeptidase/acylaminoacyl peptidase